MYDEYPVAGMPIKLSIGGSVSAAMIEPLDVRGIVRLAKATRHPVPGAYPC